MNNSRNEGEKFRTKNQGKKKDEKILRWRAKKENRVAGGINPQRGRKGEKKEKKDIKDEKEKKKNRISCKI